LLEAVFCLPAPTPAFVLLTTLHSPPPIVPKAALAKFALPPDTTESNCVELLQLPPPTVVLYPLTVLNKPPPINPQFAQELFE
jgi:hypothetical protein